MADINKIITVFEGLRNMKAGDCTFSSSSRSLPLGASTDPSSTSSSHALEGASISFQACSLVQPWQGTPCCSNCGQWSLQACSFPLKREVARLSFHCARRTSTALSCGFREQKGRSGRSLRLLLMARVPGAQEQRGCPATLPLLHLNLPSPYNNFS